jgi:hypothetical protein
VEDFPVRPDDDELPVAEFEMLELEPELDERLRVTVDAVLRAGEPEVELWRIDPELLELALLSTIPVRTLRRWTPDRREHELARLRAEQAEVQRAERAAFLAGLADLHLDLEPRSRPATRRAARGARSQCQGQGGARMGRSAPSTGRDA